MRVENYYNDQILEDTFWEDFGKSFIFVMKFVFFPIYFVILFYRNSLVLWSDKKLAGYIRDCKKRIGNQKLTDEIVLKHLHSLGIFCVDEKDIRAVMKTMTACKRNNEKVNGSLKTFFDVFCFLFTKKDMYIRLKLV